MTDPPLPLPLPAAIDDLIAWADAMWVHHGPDASIRRWGELLVAGREPEHPLDDTHDEVP